MTTLTMLDGAVAPAVGLAAKPVSRVERSSGAKRSDGAEHDVGKGRWAEHVGKIELGGVGQHGGLGDNGRPINTVRQSVAIRLSAAPGRRLTR